MCTGVNKWLAEALRESHRCRTLRTHRKWMTPLQCWNSNTQRHRGETPYESAQVLTSRGWLKHAGAEKQELSQVQWETWWWRKTVWQEFKWITEQDTDWETQGSQEQASGHTLEYARLDIGWNNQRHWDHWYTFGYRLAGHWHHCEALKNTGEYTWEHIRLTPTLSNPHAILLRQILSLWLTETQKEEGSQQLHAEGKIWHWNVEQVSVTLNIFQKLLGVTFHLCLLNNDSCKPT